MGQWVVYYSQDYDAALIIVKGGSGRPIVELESSEDCFDQPESACDLHALGWWRLSTTEEKVEMYQEVPIRSVQQKSCKKQLKSERKSVTSNMICVGKLRPDLCEDDSGGPLFSGDKQVGIMSWSDGCAQQKIPRVYTSVPKLLPWIKQELASISEVIALPCIND